MKAWERCSMLIVLCFIFILPKADAQLTKQQGQNQLIDKIEDHLEQRDFIKAKQLAFKRLSDKITDTTRLKLYFLIGDSYQEMYIIDSAQIYLEKQQKLIEQLDLQNTLYAADAYFLSGKNLRSNAAYQKSIEALEKAKTIYIEQLGKHHVKVGETYRRIGISYGGMRKESASFENYTQALAVFKKSLPEEHLSIADVYNNLGNYYKRTNAFKEAQSNHKKALKVRQNILGNLHPLTANSYINLATIYKIKSDYIQSIQVFEKALQIYQDKYGYDEHPLTTTIYGAIGHCYQQLGNYEKAKFYFERVLQLSLNKFNSGDFALAEAYGYMVAILMATEETLSARNYVEKVRKIHLKNGGPDSYWIGLNSIDLGNIYAALDQHEKAIEYYKKGKKIILKVKPQEFTYTTTADYNIGITYNDFKDHENALIYHKKALSVRKEKFGLRHWHTINSYEGVIESLNFLQRYDEAIDTFHHVLGLLNYKLEDPYKFSSSLRLVQLQETLIIGTLVYARMNIKEKGLYQRKLIDLFDYLLALQDYIYQNASTQTNHNYFLKTSFPIYEKGIKHTLAGDAIDKNEKAFLIAEKNKTRHLTANIKKEHIQNFISIPDELLEQERQINTELTYTSNKVFELNAPLDNDSLLNHYQDQIFELQRQQETLIETFKNKYPKYFKLKYDPTIITVNQLQEKIQSDQTILEYFVGEENIFVFVIGKNDFYVHEINKDFPLEEWIETLRVSIYEYWTAPNLSQKNAKISYDDFVNSASNLYQKLLAPVADQLTEKLIIIPDGKLNFIPFDALLTTSVKEGDSNYAELAYMLRKYQISYNYSANLFAYLLDQKSLATSNKVLSVAPVFEGLEDVFRSVAELRAGYGALAFNQDEAAAVAQLMDGIILSGAKATKEAFLQHAPSSQIIHLATHSKSNDNLGDYSYMAFQSSEGSNETYTHLYARELYNLKLNADLVVLSACESGLGELKRGEGVIGLARAFAYAGAKSTVTSLWSVSDQETTRLMKSFYMNLKAGQTKDEALRNAKLEYINTAERKAPFFWAGFIPSGNMQAIILQDDKTQWSFQNIFIFAFLVVFTGLIFKFVRNSKN